MHQPSAAIERFFRAFETNASSHDVEAQVSQFADVFMAAGPHGMQAVRAADFALALPKKKQLFDSMGCRSSELVSLREERLDARYVLASTQWKMTFERPGITPQDVVVESMYIVDTGSKAAEAGAAAADAAAAGAAEADADAGEAAKIVFYLANQDVMQIVKDRGLLPA
jgi:hypothetical protein